MKHSQPDENRPYDIIVVGAGSGGLSVSLFMVQAGFRTLLIDRSDHDIGGDCLNDGCIPSKALIHVSRIVHQAREARKFGLTVGGSIDARKVSDYLYNAQEWIRKHENAKHFRAMGLQVALGDASFAGKNAITVESNIYYGHTIILATGSRPARLDIPGIETVKYYDNESIFDLNELPQRLLVVGGGPVGVEIGQAMLRLGVEVTLVHRRNRILKNDHPLVTAVLEARLRSEGMTILLNTEVISFTSSSTAQVRVNGTLVTMTFDAIFVATGRTLNVENLKLENAGIRLAKGKIIADQYLRTSNPNVYLCGDVAGDLKFSHAAEHHARIILNNLFSPFKKKLSNDYLSWVTFTDPEIATFGLTEKQLTSKNIKFIVHTTGFDDDDRAVVDDHRYGKLVLFLSQGNVLTTQKILGGTMVAPGAGELIQELILANAAGLSINAIFNKIYPYPVAARINQRAIVDLKSKSLTPFLKKLLRVAYTLFR